MLPECRSGQGFSICPAHSHIHHQVNNGPGKGLSSCAGQRGRPALPCEKNEHPAQSGSLTAVLPCKDSSLLSREQQSGGKLVTCQS